ncbi:MAG: glycosyltransferase family 4 protein [Actinobacteria bacterium]|jgi:phosphatidylinositol alpha-1,6-mannosyltransferase|nr:glycosyltransferase family 4 protein [Actinomycetota bacterium]MBT3686482.1 glycosyltransferase family 4 protein [Actinomycetota bacterium]MBT4036419.1 glycosyltransferase family 4 protein [Actinomycetota bacterium]MBT4278041.1 glycosyltransferase family 4 protein [Actinomycetota bacterium]MBT4343277.1 glycosyltransferase family 4 protein [Actinomycetota bacterium]
MRRHLLVTNDFPPKLGGIQSYLWELWRRLPPEDFSVHTTPYRGADEFDAAQGFDVTRSREPFLLPYPWLPGRVNRLSKETGSKLVIWDPALPVGLSALSTGQPYAVVLHGAEVTIPGRLPFTRGLLGKVLRGASLVICAGRYAEAEAERAARCSLPTLIVPPGVDTDRFSPLDRAERDSVRTELGLPTDAPVVVGVSRLVPRKGMDVLVRAAGRLRSRFPDLVVAIAGTGRERRRLADLIEHTAAPVRLLGRVPDRLLSGVYGAGDVFAMPCRSRWRGLEQEGFGIVFVEAAACGVPQVAGDSGGAAEAVEHGVTGLVVEHPDSDREVAEAISQILDDEQTRDQMSRESRERAVREFSYDVLADHLRLGIDNAELRT